MLLHRYKLPETPRYTLDVIRDEEKAKRNMDKVIHNEKNWDDHYIDTQEVDRCVLPIPPLIQSATICSIRKCNCNWAVAIFPGIKKTLLRTG